MYTQPTFSAVAPRHAPGWEQYVRQEHYLVMCPRDRSGNSKMRIIVQQTAHELVYADKDLGGSTIHFFILHSESDPADPPSSSSVIIRNRSLSRYTQRNRRVAHHHRHHQRYHHALYSRLIVPSGTVLRAIYFSQLWIERCVLQPLRFCV